MLQAWAKLACIKIMVINIVIVPTQYICHTCVSNANDRADSCQNYARIACFKFLTVFSEKCLV